MFSLRWSGALGEVMVRRRCWTHNGDRFAWVGISTYYRVV